MSELPNLSTLGIHGHDEIESEISDVAPPIGVSTIFRYPEDLDDVEPYRNAADDRRLVYSRVGTRNVYNIEATLGKIIGGYAVTYSAGVAAFYGLVVTLAPKQIFVGHAYHGVLGIAQILKRNYGVEVHDIDSDPALIQKGDLVHVESPVNPWGTAVDLSKYAKIAKERGAYFSVDATFAPPPLIDPFKFGADIVMHSGSKYFGGHSDLLLGVLAVKSAELRDRLLFDRVFLGTIPQSLESWLVVRSLRTYALRVTAQAENAAKVVKYLVEHKDELPDLEKVNHSSLQDEEWRKEQLPRGGPVFSIFVKDEATARALPKKLKYFFHSTSLGGVESLVEWRFLTDSRAPTNLLRISIGIENVEDLISDLTNALK